MSDILLDERCYPSMFPQEYVRSVNTAIRETGGILRIGQLHNRIRELNNRICDAENSGNEHPGTLYVELDTLLFELKAISHILQRTSWSVVEYEPIGNERNGKTIDLKIVDDSSCNLIEFKVTNPRTRETRVPVEHFSADTLHANGMYYNWISSARGHLLEFLIATENKLANYSGNRNGVLCVYKNFYVEEDELESLWHFYVTGKPHPGDAFGGMMEHELQKKGLEFKGYIDELWALEFPQYGFEIEEGGFMRFAR